MHGMEPKYHHAVIGGNFRLDALQAALLSVKLPHLSDYAARRRQNAALYRERLGALRAAGGFDFAGARFRLRACLEPVYRARTGAGRRDALRDTLTAHGIGSEIYYPVPLHEQACFAHLGYRSGDFPVAHRLAGEVLSLPIFPELKEGAIDEVCRAMVEFFRGAP